MSLTDAESYALLDELFGYDGPDDVPPDSGTGVWLVTYASESGLHYCFATSGGEVAGVRPPHPGTTITVEWVTGARLDDLLAMEDAYFEAQERIIEAEGHQR